MIPLRLALFATLLAAANFSATAGVALRLYYRNVLGAGVADLTNHASFPNKPASVEPITESLEKLVESGDYYGTWTRGYIEAPQTGLYTFMLSSDDDAELWLSTDYHSAHRRKIAENRGFVRPRHFSEKPEQDSVPIALVKGEKYYFDLYHKDWVGYDHVSVAWRLPGGTTEIPLSANHLFPFPVDEKLKPVEKAPVILTNYFGQPVRTLTNVSVIEGETVTLAVNVEGSLPLNLQWYRNHHLISGANLSTLTIDRVTLRNDADLYTVVVSNRLGKARAEAVLSVRADVISPKANSVLSLDHGRSMAVFFSEPLNPASARNSDNYLLNETHPTDCQLDTSQKTVLLKTKTSLPARYLRLRNITDQAAVPNLIDEATVPVESALKALLTFDENEPGEVIDSSGPTVVANLKGKPAIVPGKIGRALAFDGTNDYVQLPAGMSDFVSGLTIALWAKPSVMKVSMRFISLGNETNRDSIAFGRLTDSNNLVFEVRHGDEMVGYVIGEDAIELEAWQHFAVTMDRTGHLVLFKNGSIIAEGGTAVPIMLKRTCNYIGRGSSGDGLYYGGALDEVRIYSRALAPAEIKMLFSEASPTK